MRRPLGPGRIYELFKGEWMRVAEKGGAIRVPRDAMAEWRRMPPLNEVCS